MLKCFVFNAETQFHIVTQLQACLLSQVFVFLFSECVHLSVVQFLHYVHYPSFLRTLVRPYISLHAPVWAGRPSNRRWLQQGPPPTSESPPRTWVSQEPLLGQPGLSVAAASPCCESGVEGCRHPLEDTTFHSVHGQPVK